MSNPTELPDLDRLEALAKAAEQMFTGMHWYTRFQILDGISNDESAAFIGALDPDTVLALVALARRAQPEVEAPQADAPAPSAAAMDDVVDNLREYASNAGYSHNDYQDTMRQAANTIEALRAQLWHWGPGFAAQQAAAPGALDLQRMRAAFHTNMLRAYPDKSHEEIAAEIDKAIGAAPSAPGAPEAPAEPFMYAISTPAGKAYFDEHCVDTNAEALEAEASFMSQLHGVEYRVVPVYLRAAQLDGGQEGSESNG